MSESAVRLAGKVVIVTGGGQGMGRAMSFALVAAGAAVAVVDIAEDAARAVSDDIRAAHGPKRSLAIAADLRDREQCFAAVRRTLAEFGGVHALINNAGMGMTAVRKDYLEHPVRFWEVDPDRWQAVMDLNVRAPFAMAQAAAPHFLAQGFGRIVNVTTSLDTMYRAAYSPYGPSKAALEAATVGWARDLEGTGVTCNALIPGGAVNTAFFDASAPLQRETLIQPETMGRPVCWLVSDESSMATGRRYIARLWNAALPDAEAAELAGAPAAWQALGAQSLWPGAKPVK